MNNLLSVKNLKTYFHTNNEVVKAVDGISFDMNKNEIFAIVGESGSGKSVTALSIMSLIQLYHGKVMGGEILFNDTNLLTLSKKEIQHIRGSEISMIYQDPMSSLNPVMSVGEQIRETLIIHNKLSKNDSKQKSINLMSAVGIPEAELRYNDLPKKFSGGMRQRIMIAMAIANNPKLLIADEPTTALDVTIQAEIMKLLRALKDEMEMSIILITHDLGLVAENADRVLIMYCGEVMEQADVEGLFHKPLHPYTMGLIKCIPKVESTVDKLYSIPGSVHHPTQLPCGCKFSQRCDKAMDICFKEKPELIEIDDNHKVRCWLYGRGINHEE